VKVLVTGAAGFLGSALVEAFRGREWEVRAFVRPGRQRSWPEGVEEFVGDLCEVSCVRDAVAGTQAVVHAAARVSTTGTWEEFASINVRATMDLLQAARQAGVQRFVHMSSLSVVAVPRDGYTVIDESPYEDESRARGNYSRSKLAADRLALWEARQGAPVVVLRPGLLWGPGRRPPLARQSFLWKGYRFLLARPDYPLPLSHVRSVAQAAVCAVESGPEAVGRAFTVVDVHVPQQAWLEAYREAMGEWWRPVYLPVRLMELVARTAEVGFRILRRRPPVTAHQVARATYRAWYDCRSAQTVLGWQPRTDWRRDLQEVVESLKSEPRG